MRIPLREFLRPLFRKGSRPPPCRAPSGRIPSTPGEGETASAQVSDLSLSYPLNSYALTRTGNMAIFYNFANIPGS